ncbi:uroporphyrinogen-III decarboxylase [Lactonifactor longoviformis]|uniref:Uroporphyrinogen decarboxylase (URO-D) n=1 Tax=Lactonifactor longoviformis DSM 17459 TaxID=1122155 RepID=A0A1M4ZYB8_9CLOT|nr:uroporphyrinogen decarboxylase family protein [Lactonifactor longoviformis]POP31833.1 uroporphyrinogen-III decarboxylase [Lactonifactor longoviformis]SHF22857.1 Uroporphyrinogen decarboxylase (URO-D) [Lactonifactor longoviformis DSM 17459]
MTPRENVLEVINWGNPEYVPLMNECDPYFFSGVCNLEMTFGGPDAFGVNWVSTPEGSIPEPGKFLFCDISEWRDYVKIPDVDKIDFKAMAKHDLVGFDWDNKLLNFFYPAGLFDRLVAFMGFENALISLAEDPESCDDFFHEMMKYRIQVLERAIEAYKPDMVTYVDDMAHAKGLFISPETYRKLIKPYHRQIVQTVKSRGVIFNQHICGKCEDLLDDFVEIGVQVWNSAQPINDLAAVQKKYKGKLVVEGGWDTSGPASYLDSSIELVMEEAMRNIKEYGVNKGFIFWPIIMNKQGNGMIVGDERLDKLTEVWPTISRIY